MTKNKEKAYKTRDGREFRQHHFLYWNGTNLGRIYNIYGRSYNLGVIDSSGLSDNYDFTDLEIDTRFISKEYS